MSSSRNDRPSRVTDDAVSMAALSAGSPRASPSTSPTGTGPAVGAALGIVLSALGVAATIAAGFFGWMLVQDCHVGIRLAPEQEFAEPAVQHHQPPIALRRRPAA